MVPNPYTLLSEIPERVKYFSVIDFKFAFWVKPILNHPLPMTLRQLRGFFGIVGYCCIWIPSYGELAWPLYKLITETQQAQTDKLLWSPDTQRLLRLFRLLSCKLQLEVCPQGQKLICHWNKRYGLGIFDTTPKASPAAYRSVFLNSKVNIWMTVGFLNISHCC